MDVVGDIDSVGRGVGGEIIGGDSTVISDVEHIGDFGDGRVAGDLLTLQTGRPPEWRASHQE